MDQDVMMTPNEIGMMLGISTQQVERLLGKADGIPAFVVAGQKRAWKSSVMAYLARNANAHKDKKEEVRHAATWSGTLHGRA